MSASHERLLSRIRRQFDVVTQPHILSGKTFQFTRVTDPDVVLDEIVAEEDRREKLAGKRSTSDELRLPYWAELWDSAFGIGQFLLQQTSPEPMDVLDLGCGMGFAGMIAASMGHRVLFADLEPAALLFAQLNTPTGRTRRLDWRRDRLNEQFKLILGADVLYDKTQWDFLEPFWRAHLSSGGTVLMGEPGRQTGDLFVDWISVRGWTLERFEERVITRTTPIRLFRLHISR